ncbi:hypothetical protein [Solidesulfovibrio sp.]|uniref:hypothetical protein n=1 Tax=Solidesulfovibrio sp. TaxID=2910990 RepID=UPI0026119735|nr:hypothetical protein [Solidesulfovibrio sp.]
MRKKMLREAACGLCAALVILSCGCAKRETAAPPVPPTPPQVAEAPAPTAVSAACEPTRNSLYDQGVCSFDTGEVKRAMGLWRTAAGTDPDPAVRRKALFAMAAVKLAQANTDAEMAAAMEMFDAWSKASPPGGSGEEPRFLLPALRNLKPAAALREQKAALERECAKKLAEREEQVRKSVQQQVRALETIHQQIQEKKKGLINN